MQTFRDKVIMFIQKVPKGKVASYGQIAAAAGSPRAARQVGGILRALENSEQHKNKPNKNKVIPWWRIVNAQGYLSIRGNWTATKEIQAQLLRKEKVIVDENFTLDMSKYRFRTK